MGNNSQKNQPISPLQEVVKYGRVLDVLSEQQIMFRAYRYSYTSWLYDDIIVRLQYQPITTPALAYLALCRLATNQVGKVVYSTTFSDGTIAGVLFIRPANNGYINVNAYLGDTGTRRNSLVSIKSDYPLRLHV